MSDNNKEPLNEGRDSSEAGTANKLLSGDGTVSSKQDILGNEDLQNERSNDEFRLKKRRRVIEYEELIKDLPTCEAYERSYMHRETITHIIATKTDFLITGSTDGVVKFWKKIETGIEFVKHFKVHVGSISDMRANSDGILFGTCSEIDKTVKIFDVVNFDMINMINLIFVPRCLEWISSVEDPADHIAFADKESNKIYIYDAKTLTPEPAKVLEKTHLSPVIKIRFNSIYKIVVSIDDAGFVEYWYNSKHDFDFVQEGVVSFDSKMDTDLYEFYKNKATLNDLTFSPDGKYFATCSSDRKIMIFKFLSGKLVRVFDESLSTIEEYHRKSPQLSNMEFSRRMAVERDIDKAGLRSTENILFDQTGCFIIYTSIFGIKVYNWYNNKLINTLGKAESIRPLQMALCQGPIANDRFRGIEQNVISDPTLFCTAYKKNRFYCFSKRHPEDPDDDKGFVDRDIFNEKPSREDIIASVETSTKQQQIIFENATIHTTMGDIHLVLYAKQAPKAVENFCTHSKNNYYNNHIFHRVIKQFMIQTGDPTGTGTGGESIWNMDFCDEFNSELKHDKPYMLSMANAGPDTNGSQFFITVVPCPWLDNKHTIFGRVVRGMDVVQGINNTKVDSKTDRPFNDIKIININVF